MLNLQPREMTSIRSSIFPADHGGCATNVAKIAAWSTIQCPPEIGISSTYFLYVMRQNSRVFRPLCSYSPYEDPKGQGIPDITFNKRKSELYTVVVMMLLIRPWATTNALK